MFGFGRKQPTTGVERAVMRPKRMLPKAALVDLPSRQQRRAKQRQEAKRQLSIAKRDAMKLKWPGGAAAVR